MRNRHVGDRCIVGRPCVRLSTIKFEFASRSPREVLKIVIGTHVIAAIDPKPTTAGDMIPQEEIPCDPVPVSMSQRHSTSSLPEGIKTNVVIAGLHRDDFYFTVRSLKQVRLHHGSGS